MTDLENGRSEKAGLPPCTILSSIVCDVETAVKLANIPQDEVEGRFTLRLDLEAGLLQEPAYEDCEDDEISEITEVMLPDICRITAAGYDPAQLLKNTALQEKFAQAIGILGKDEAWKDFIRDRSEVIRTGESISYRVPTKYPDIGAVVKFLSADRSGPLEKSLDKGESTPLLTLQLPTELFFQDA